MDSINPKYTSKPTKDAPSIATLVQGITDGDTLSLSMAISLAESNKLEDKQSTIAILNSQKQDAKESIRIGITGPPGVGKSTFIDAYGYYLAEKGFKIAVLAIDPTSSLSHGSILGDKTRMEKLAFHPNAFIRPSPSSLHLGGVAPSTWTAIKLCELAGYDYIFIESVGVGQSEVSLQKMVDIYSILLLPGSGDELQGIKKGILEIGDIFIVNKSDGDFLSKANEKRISLQNALKTTAKSNTRIMQYSSLLQEKTDALDATISKLIQSLKSTGDWNQKRLSQKEFWFDYEIKAQMGKFIQHHPIFAEEIQKFKEKTLNNELQPMEAAHLFFNTLLEKFQ